MGLKSKGENKISNSVQKLVNKYFNVEVKPGEGILNVDLKERWTSSYFS